MFFIKLYIVFLVTLSPTLAVRVDMAGKLTLGRDVAGALSSYFGDNTVFNDTRRRFKPKENISPNTLPYIVKSHLLCDGLFFCVGKRGAFVEEYVISLTDKIEDLLSTIIEDMSYKLTPSTLVFEKPLLKCLKRVRATLQLGDKSIKEDKESYVWVSTVKNIAAIYNDIALQFLSDLFTKKAVKPGTQKKREIQKLVLTIAITGNVYENKLCVDHNICTNSYLCTRTLESAFDVLHDLPDSKQRDFMKYFYESLPTTKLLYILNESTANEFQVILSEMAFNQLVPSGEIIDSVQRAVAARLSYIEANKQISVLKVDVQLLNAILSDMDFFLASDNSYDLNQFMSKFSDWSQRGGRLTTVLKGIFAIVSDSISKHPKILVSKLSTEVKVFLELTVDADER